MKQYVELSTRNVYEFNEIRRLHPDKSIPWEGDLTSLGYAEVVKVPAPAPLPWNRVVAGGIAPDNSETWVQQPMSPADIRHECKWKIQERLDNFAKTKGYDSMLAATSYTASTTPGYAAEGRAAMNQRDATWKKYFEILADVDASVRPMPSLTQLMSELPVLSW